MDKHRVAIVSTSINAAPVAYKAWSELGTLIVAGDVNSPPELRSYVNDECSGIFLDAQSQNSYTPGGEYIGWKNIQRRNAATWFALTGAYDFVVTVDDDNLPLGTNWVDGHALNLETRPKSTMGSSSAFLNTGALCLPPFHQRGSTVRRRHVTLREPGSVRYRGTTRRRQSGTGHRRPGL
jgi:hypothetical protein